LGKAFYTGERIGQETETRENGERETGTREAEAKLFLGFPFR
jgi:hypothetical protein